MARTGDNPANGKQERGGKYLTFALAEEDYGLEIRKVREIIRMMDITSVPHTPAFVKGVINLRGKVIPVIDLRLKFGLEATVSTKLTCIIVVDVGTQADEQVEMGILVDRVSEVLEIAEVDIEDAPSFGTQVNTEFILGMGKARGTVSILLNISRVLTSEELDTVQDVSAS